MQTTEQVRPMDNISAVLEGHSQWTVECGDCRDLLTNIPACSVDACVTDPPYELGFMGKSWDRAGVSYDAGMWRQVFRTLKPGGYLLSFGGSRTCHRMACAVEDAGFEMRDQIMWIYGEGFPKSLDISKAIDKAAGVEREVVGNGPYANRRPRVAKSTQGAAFSDDAYVRPAGQPVSLPTTDGAKHWQGWGTALKPAHEPIVMARKPLSEGNVAANVLKYGCGGINVDACRIPTAETLHGGAGGLLSHCRDSKDYPDEHGYQQSDGGRWPANIILDERAAAVLDEQSGILESGGTPTSRSANRKQYFGYGGQEVVTGLGPNSGGASRFFYVAKASPAERGVDNNHPTVKPVTLMQYLVRLVTPLGGVVLDPFCGSGTTGMAALREGMRFIGYDLSADYCGLSTFRITSDAPLLNVPASHA
jgi:hypothetical protein